MKEKEYYTVVKEWFARDKGCVSKGTDYKLDGLGLLTGDIVSSKGDLLYACELKNYPYPVGSQGWGSIGQALALRQHVDFIYVGCVASEVSASGNNNWRRASATYTMQKLLSHLGIELPQTFDEFRGALESVFRYFFGDLGIGLLVIHETSSGDQGQPSLKVTEIVTPRRTGRAPSNSRCT
jgi:hypothetical protein